MTLTKIEFIENSEDPKLTRAVLNQLGASWTELKERPLDYRTADSGVPGFVYYDETVPFAKRNYRAIIDRFHQFQHDTGGALKPPKGDDTQYYNWMAWFALETIVQELMDAIGHY